MPTATKSDVLKTVPLFDGIRPRQLKRIADQFREETFRAGADLVRQGDAGGRIFVIANGFVKISVNGRTRRTDGPGSVIGELSVFDRGPRGATVTAAGEVAALTMSSSSFLALLEDEPAVARHVMGVLARRLRECERLLTA
jgi:CRP-like cAMP-binding protein